jgi:hypothetical protein
MIDLGLVVKIVFICIVLIIAHAIGWWMEH